MKATSDTVERQARTFAAVLIVVFIASDASAATVTLTLDLTTPGHFKVLASASAGDNAGLASYFISLLGNITSFDHLSPSASLAQGGESLFGPAGFTLLRSADGDTTFGASQDTITPTPHIIYGMGQETNSFAALGLTPLGPPPEQPAWDAEMLLAEGTYTGPIDFDRSTIDNGANVFATRGALRTIAANLDLQNPSFDPFPIGLETDLGQRQRFPTIFHEFEAIGAPAFTWGSLVHNGPPVGNTPTLNSGGFFRWNPFSAGLGVHTFDATVTNAFGSDVARLTITIVPEPATFLLLCLAMIGLVSHFGRRGRCAISTTPPVSFVTNPRSPATMHTGRLEEGVTLKTAWNIFVRRYRALGSILVLVIIASPVHAATVTFTLAASGGQFQVFAQASSGDNFGIAAYNIPLVGNVTSVNHVSPNTAFAQDAALVGGPAGFTFFRSPDGNQIIGATQDFFTATPHVIRGFGQTANSFAGLGLTLLAPAEQSSWHSKLLIAEGTYTGSLEFNSTSVDLGALVLNSPVNSGRDTASVFLVTQPLESFLVAVDKDLGERTRVSVIDHQFQVTAGVPPITWSNLIHSGPAVGNLPILNADGAFTWDPATAGFGVHTFDAMATNLSSSDVGRLTITIVPEPATMSLLGLAMIGLVAYFGRRSR